MSNTLAATASAADEQAVGAQTKATSRSSAQAGDDVGQK
jgi:hypothetical protein